MGDLLVENAADISLVASVYTTVHTLLSQVSTHPLPLVAVLMVITP